MVVYNASGQLLRAARTPSPLLAEHGIYWWRTGCQKEAAYLVSILNAESIQPFYQAARKSDRHFDQHIWREVPIPRYNPGNPHHVQLAVLCAQAEEIAKDVAAGIKTGGQVKRSTTIRSALRHIGLVENTNRLAAEVVC